ncbi:MAG TPA: ATP-binding cassette domain-containing protein [Chitinophagaceae bacterium]|nr:ATP-binding cassette domain-containing protein [Chitinophagaceae bacterium]
MVELSQIEKYFHRGLPGEVKALDGVSLRIPAREFAVIIGFNGSGKTTLLNMIAGTLFPDSGKVLIRGHEVSRRKDYQRSKWISRVFQDPMAGTAPDLTIMDNFRLASLRTRSKSLRTGVESRFRIKVRDQLAILGMGLENHPETLVGKLSGGQRQALTLLMAVMDEASILLLDEPTAALDPRSSELIIRLAGDLIGKLGLTAVMVTHDLRHAAAYGTRLIMMEQGKISKDLDSGQKADCNLASLVQWFT